MAPPTPADPLCRSDDKELAPSYHRGFFAAEQRKERVDGEPSLAGMVFSGMISALPVVGMAYFILRSQYPAAVVSKAASKAGQKQGGMMADMQKMMDQMQNPLGTRDFLCSYKDKSFKDVIGVPEAKSEIQQYVEFLKDPARFTRLGARLPKGCLLTGDPGTGKTLLAKAVAGEASVPFYTCSGADFIEVYAGSGPKRVRELFAQAKADAPSVIFIDEIDAVGSRHSSSSSSGSVSGEENRTVNQLLAEMDGLQGNESVVIFAATNYVDNIDKAMLREGRFDRKVDVPMPDRPARQELFSHFLQSVITGDAKGRLTPPADPPTVKTAEDGSTTTVQPAPPEPVPADAAVSNTSMAEHLSGLTPGVSPATISTIVNEAALAAAVNGDKYVRMSHLLPAIDDVLVGKKHRSRMTDAAARRVALHEAGHCLVAWMLPQQTDVIKLSITPRGNAGGFTQQVGRETLEMPTDAVLFTDICVMLGGRIAESLRHDDVTTGAYDDLQRATQNAMRQFLAFGMSDQVGLLAFDYQRIDHGRVFQLCSSQHQHMAEKEARAIVRAAMGVTEKLLLVENRSTLLALADALAERKEMLHADIEAILGPRPPNAATQHAVPEASTGLPSLPVDLPPMARKALDRFVKAATVDSRSGDVQSRVSQQLMNEA